MHQLIKEPADHSEILQPGGMLAASGIAIFFIPVTFYVVERLATGRKSVRPEKTVPPAAQPVVVT